MTRPRVLLVDDSVVVRRRLCEIVESEPRLEVAGSAPSASIAFQKLDQLNPDVVVLDVEMPDIDGIEAAATIHRRYPSLPILMCSALTEKGAEVSLRALAAGATDCIAKPTSQSGGAGLSAFRLELIEKLCALGERRLDESRPPVPVLPRATLPRSTAAVEAIAIGCSTGGPNALSALFTRMPAPLPVPVFIVQHMPPLFTRLLAERLTASTGHQVAEAIDGDAIAPRRVYIAPGGFHLTIVRDGLTLRTRLNQEPPENSCRPAVDVLFRSAAQHYRAGLLSAVLTGMGHDGTRGARAVVEAGGSVVVQQADGCVVPSMPLSVLNEGLAADVLSLERLGDHLVKCAALGRQPTGRAVA